MSGTVHTRTLRRAIETLGSSAQLTRALGASIADVKAWAAGFERPPPGVFLRAIDIVAGIRLSSLQKKS